MMPEETGYTHIFDGERFDRLPADEYAHGVRIGALSCASALVEFLPSSVAEETCVHTPQLPPGLRYLEMDRLGHLDPVPLLNIDSSGPDARPLQHLGSLRCPANWLLGPICTIVQTVDAWLPKLLTHHASWKARFSAIFVILLLLGACICRLLALTRDPSGSRGFLQSAGRLS